MMTKPDNPTHITLVQQARIASLALLVAVFFFSHQLRAEDIDSLSKELLEQVGDTAFWQVKIQCKGGFPSIVIRQKLSQDDWCIVSGKLACQKTKLKMAHAVCSNISSLAEVAQKPTEVVVEPIEPQQPTNTLALKSAEAAKAEQDWRVARIKREQKAKETQVRVRERLVLESAINEEQLALQEARVKLDQEKLEVELIELRLESRAKAIQQQLQSLK